MAIKNLKASYRQGFMPGPRYCVGLSENMQDPFMLKATKVCSAVSSSNFLQSESTQDRIWNVTILGNARFRSCMRIPKELLTPVAYSEFYIQIKKTAYGNIIIGVAEKNIDQNAESNQFNNGYGDYEAAN